MQTTFLHIANRAREYGIILRVKPWFIYSTQLHNTLPIKSNTTPPTGGELSPLPRLLLPETFSVNVIQTLQELDVAYTAGNLW